VTGIDPNTPIDKKLRVSDVITHAKVKNQLDRHQIRSRADIENITNWLAERTVVTLSVWRVEGSSATQLEVDIVVEKAELPS
jgi:hypothetical protein